MLAFGEVQTGLLQNSTAVTGVRAAEVVDLVLGEPVRRFERPIAYAVSPDRPEGVDCRLPTASGAHVHAVGTLITHAALVGGHVLQGSSHSALIKGDSDRRQPWSHYLGHPGCLETIGRVRMNDVKDGLLTGTRDCAVLDLPAITGRILDDVQRSPLLDHRPALRAPRLRLRWVAETGARTLAAEFAVRSEELRTFRISVPGEDLSDVVALCEDLALHDWLLTTLSTLVEKALTGDRQRRERVSGLQPAVDHLLHLWMPAVRVAPDLLPVWDALEMRPGFSRQWKTLVRRVRDQLTMSALALLEARRD
ncbi:SCO2521 family protein [Actinoplanes sp. NPDC051343]|jgi:hypothetical protein|uniref:SCO2521 family protein n=1 Tax=Actinoplanes sp. NPDC051343 TaxID=3363906 RepID=UPI00378BEB24